MFDLKVMEMKEGIVNLINECNLPASVICYVLKEIEQMAEQTLQQNLQQQSMEKKQHEHRESESEPEHVEAEIVE